MQALKLLYMNPLWSIVYDYMREQQDYSAMREKPLDFRGTRFPEGHRAHEIGERVMLRNVNELLKRNPQVLSDLNAEHAKQPGEVTMVIIPGILLVIARYDDQLRAMIPSITCSLNAIGRLLFSRYNPDGYMIARSSPQYPEFLDNLYSRSVEEKGSIFNERSQELDWTNTSGYLNFNAQAMNPGDWLAAAMEGIISEGKGGSPRLKLPISEKK